MGRLRPSSRKTGTWDEASQWCDRLFRSERNWRQGVNGLLVRRTAGIGVILLMASLVVLIALPVAAIEGNCTALDGGWDVGVTSGSWGTITNNGNGSVTVALNLGYSLELCVKGGNGYEVYNVSGTG